MTHYDKYLKYKNKYISLKNQRESLKNQRESLKNQLGGSSNRTYYDLTGKTLYCFSDIEGGNPFKMCNDELKENFIFECGIMRTNLHITTFWTVTLSRIKKKKKNCMDIGKFYFC